MLHRNALWTAALILAAAAPAFAQGIVIPNDPDLPPLSLIHHRVKVDIDRQGATTTVEQVFLNNTDRPLEAQYIFPIPRGAAMSRFTMLMNGKEKAGELVEKNQARQIYNSIVNRSRDPGLLEYLGGELFRANIFPIPPRGSQTITLRFEQVLTLQDNLVSYVYPVRAAQKHGPVVQGEFSFEATLRSQVPILSVYSPSHGINVARASDRDARVTYADRRATLDRDLQLYYGVSEKEIGLNLVTYRPNPNEPGYFMLLLAPRSTLQAQRIVERDLVFVVDTSGSMAGAKIQQARNALKYLVGKLNEGDRFNIVSFSSFAETWQKGLVPAKERREDALKYADTLIAQGGTDIAGALDAAVSSLGSDPARPSYIVFMTDGKPTMGETTDARRILAKVTAAKGRPNGAAIRLFMWGVGYDVDTHLLDDLANEGGGVSDYVRPEEDIATKIAAFANKASSPVLTGLDLQLIGSKVQLANMLPRALPDLYAGGQLVLLGRYTGDGDVAFELSGNVNGKVEKFVYETKFAATEAKGGFIELLWAQRRIGFLLDQIRLHGETKELVDDVIRLSKEYGIQTPYTSTLILEDGTSPTVGQAPRPGFRGGRGEAEKKLDALRQNAPETPKAAPTTAAAKEAADLEESLVRRFKDKDGKAGVDVARRLREMKEADRAGVSGFRKAAGTRFILYRGLWVDERFLADAAVVSVKFGSEAYFRLLEKQPALVDAFKLGTNVVCMTPAGKALVVGDAGDETLGDAQIDALFAAKK